jgi:hypothetical protein
MRVLAIMALLIVLIGLRFVPSSLSVKWKRLEQRPIVVAVYLLGFALAVTLILVTHHARFQPPVLQ